MPARQTMVKLPIRMAAPIDVSSLCLFRGDLAYGLGFGFGKEFLRHDALNNEEGGQEAPDGDWQVRQSNPNHWKLRNALMPGHLHQFDAPPEHEHVGHQHAGL